MILTRNRTPQTAVESGPWSRARLLAMLSAFAVVLALTLVGGGLAIWYAANGNARSTVIEAVEPPGAQRADTRPTRDEIAAAAMASVDPQAAFHPDPAPSIPGAIEIPASTVLDGPAGVATGFPRTPEGAVGQFAAIEQAVLESMSLPRARDIHSAWVRPGGPGFEQWTLTRNVTSFLAAARQGGVAKDLTTVLSAAPAAALVKGADGPGWTLACVLMDVQAWIKAESRMGYGLCARMEWVEGRWQIATGAEPATAPSAWPGSKAAATAGWLAWVESEAR
jgi:hypothetical protein